MVERYLEKYPSQVAVGLALHRSRVNACRSLGIDEEEIDSALRERIIRSAAKFDPNKLSNKTGNPILFETYANGSIGFALLHIMRKKNKEITIGSKQIISEQHSNRDNDTILDDIADKSVFQNDEVYRINDLKQILETALLKISDDERELLQMRFGLAGFEPHTREAIAKKEGVTKERIGQREGEAKENLRRLIPAEIHDLLNS